jgi:hypothetical protein
VGMDLSEVNDLKASAKGARDDKDWPAALLDLHDALDIQQESESKIWSWRPRSPTPSG